MSVERAGRDTVLGRIRAALADVPVDEATRPTEGGYRTESRLPRDEVLDRFAARVAEYRAGVDRIDPESVHMGVARACRQLAVRVLAVPDDVPADWVSGLASVDVRLARDGDLTPVDLDRVDGVLTGCALGIAETGTIALDGGAAQGRRILTLVPDRHICVIRAEQVVGSVPEGIRGLERAAHAGRPITLIAGPSATSDIELRRVEGVHGPRTLQVLLVGR